MKRITIRLLCTLLLVGVCFALASCGECKHTYGDATTVAPTCTTDGKYIYTCTKCGEVKEEAPAADDAYMLKTGHTEDAGTVTVTPTCAVAGKKVFACLTCGATLREETLTAEHISDAGQITTEPTCTEPGVISYTCVNLNCGEVLSTETIEPLGHAVDATVFETDGTNHYNVCTRCEEKLNSAPCTFEMGALNAEQHATFCTACGGVKGETVAHTFGAEYTIPPSDTTCEPGKVYKVCTGCAYENILSILPGAAEHSYAFDAEASDLEQPDHSLTGHIMAYGTLVYSCTGCGDSYSVETQYAVTFDAPCSCGFSYDAGNRISQSGDIEVTKDDGELFIKGAINKAQDTNEDGVANATDNLDMRLFGSGSPMAAMTTDTVYIGFDIKQQEAGFPEWGVQTILKFNGAWVNPTLVIKDNVITFNGATLELDTTRYNNIVIRIAAETGKVSYTVWVNAQQLGSEQTFSNQVLSPDFSNHQTYGGVKVDANGNQNFDPERGMIFDNFFWSEEAPSFVTEE